MKKICCPEDGDVVELVNRERARISIPVQGETPVLSNYMTNEWQVNCITNGQHLIDVEVFYDYDKVMWREVH